VTGLRAAVRSIDLSSAPALDATGISSSDEPQLTTWKWDYVRTTLSPAVGRLYSFNLDENNAFKLAGYCSASVVSRDLVLTAGHCVYSHEAGSKHAGWVYMPGQYGAANSATEWTSTYSWVDSYYVGDANFGPLDYAFVEFKPEQNQGKHIGDTTSWFAPMWNSPGGDKWSYGYPSEGYFGSEPSVGNGGCSNVGISSCFPVYCNSPIQGSSNFRLILADANASYGGWYDVGMGCPMTGGSSGGPIFEQWNGGWYIAGVNSHVDAGAHYSCAVASRNFQCISWSKNVWAPYFNDYFGQTFNSLAGN
jgi:hypothetical protein